MWKRFFAWSLCMLFLCLLSLSAFADTMQKGSMYVMTPNGRSLHFRATRSSREDNIICEIPYGTKVYVISWDGTWARIEYNGDTGYVVKKYLHLGKPASFETVQAEREREKEERKARQALEAAQRRLDRSAIKAVDPYDVTVQTETEGGSSSLYTEASLLSDPLYECPDGTRLTVLAQNKSWAKAYDGALDKTGFILREDLVPDEIEEEILED